MCENIALSSMLAALEITINMILKENCYCAFRKQHARDVIKILVLLFGSSCTMEKEKAIKQTKDIDESNEQSTKEDVVSRGDNKKPW